MLEFLPEGIFKMNQGLGFNMFVPKPVEPNELAAAIASLAQPRSQNVAWGQMDTSVNSSDGKRSLLTDKP